jgi:hypothetical protein
LRRASGTLTWKINLANAWLLHNLVKICSKNKHLQNWPFKRYPNMCIVSDESCKKSIRTKLTTYMPINIKACRLYILYCKVDETKLTFLSNCCHVLLTCVSGVWCNLPRQTDKERERKERRKILKR